LNPHDFRRSAVKNLTDAGVDQATAMKITGHKTVAVFLRYNIVPTEKLHEASDKVVKYHAEKKTGSIKAISKQKTVAGKEQLA
jgi:site-specific recombinase XerD